MAAAAAENNCSHHSGGPADDARVCETVRTLALPQRRRRFVRRNPLQLQLDIVRRLITLFGILLQAGRDHMLKGATESAA